MCVQVWLKKWRDCIRRAPYMQQGMESAQRIVRHQDFHLTFRKILDVFVKRAGFPALTVCSASRFLVFLVAEQLPALHRETTARNLMLCRRLQEIASRFLVSRAHGHRGVRGRSDVFLESPAHGRELWQALHGKQERGVGATSRLQDLSEVSVSERRELVHYHADEGAIGPSP